MKVNFGYLTGTDWIANSEEDKLNRAVFAGVYNKDGINIYGDEVQTNIYGVAQQMVGLGLLPAGAEALVPSINVVELDIMKQIWLSLMLQVRRLIGVYITDQLKEVTLKYHMLGNGVLVKLYTKVSIDMLSKTLL